MTTHRERALGQARADLVALPELCGELARLVADRHHDITGYRGKVTGSPAPLQLPVVHLVAGGRHKPAWWGEDPRQSRWALTWYDRGNDERTAHTTVHSTQDAAWRAYHHQSGLPAPLELHQLAAVRIVPWRARDLYGAAALLETWVRMLSDALTERHELAKHETWLRDKWGNLPAVLDLTERATVRSEAAVLLEHWTFITDQGWAEELAQDVATMTSQVRAALGIRPEPKYACPQCHNPAYLQPGGILACTEVQDHHIVIRDLEQQQRRRPPMTSKQITEEFDVTLAQLWQWKHRRKISPTKTERGKHWWLPWDVFCLLNPDIAETIRLRDEMSQDDAEGAQRAIP